jgi:hypothetical protein
MGRAEVEVGSKDRLKLPVAIGRHSTLSFLLSYLEVRRSAWLVTVLPPLSVAQTALFSAAQREEGGRVSISNAPLKTKLSQNTEQS